MRQKYGNDASQENKFVLWMVIVTFLSYINIMHDLRLSFYRIRFRVDMVYGRKKKKEKTERPHHELISAKIERQ